MSHQHDSLLWELLPTPQLLRDFFYGWWLVCLDDTSHIQFRYSKGVQMRRRYGGGEEGQWRGGYLLTFDQMAYLISYNGA